MAQKSFHNALRVPRASAVQLPLFLVPSCAFPQVYTQNRPSRSRNYANHAKTPDIRLVDPNASRKHLKPDFPMNTNPKTRDKSKKRGVSVIRSTGPKQAFRGKHMNYDLPVPVIDPERRKQFPTNPDHGLWGFFWENRSALTEPEDILKHGRSWTYQELSLKTFEELHGIYWVGHKDQNRLCTGTAEIARIHAGYGEYENEHRMNTIQETNDRIRQVLQDRYESTQDAIRIVEETPLAQIDLDEAVERLDEDGYAEADEFSTADASERASQPAQTSPMAQDLSSKPSSNQ